MSKILIAKYRHTCDGCSKVIEKGDEFVVDYFSESFTFCMKCQDERTKNKANMTPNKGDKVG